VPASDTLAVSVATPGAMAAVFWLTWRSFRARTAIAR
jgi:hypothetical protein